jgi:hypothetical protein
MNDAVLLDVTPCGSWKIAILDKRIASIIRVKTIGDLRKS